MMVVDVFHKDEEKGNNEFVVRIKTPDAANETESLEYAYALTQNLEDSWAQTEHPHREFPMSMEFNDGTPIKQQRRSSMVGDLFILSGHGMYVKYQVAPIGFKKI